MNGVMVTTKNDGSAVENATHNYTRETIRPSVLERNEALFNNEFMADIHFILEKSEEIPNTINRIPAHKFILATGSSVFHAMFYGTGREEKGEVRIVDISESAFLVLLRYLYCDDIELKADSVMEILYAAKKYLVLHLAEVCAKFLITNLDVTNACSILDCVVVSDEPKVIQRCWEVIDRETELAVKAKGFEDIGIKTLESIILRETLSCSEIYIFEAASKWAAAECNRKELDPTPANKRAVLGNLLYQIRIPTMSIEEFVGQVEPEIIFETEESFNIFMHFLLKRNKPHLDFPIIPRAGCLSELKVCSRFDYSPVVVQRRMHPNADHRLVFVVDKAIYLTGIGIYGPQNVIPNCNVTIKMKSQGEDLAENTSSISFNGSSDVCRVDFQYPIQIQPNIHCILFVNFDQLKIHRYCQYSGRGGMQKLIVDGITFQFCTYFSTTNSTSVTEGQIPELLFYTMKK